MLLNRLTVAQVSLFAEQARVLHNAVLAEMTAVDRDFAHDPARALKTHTPETLSEIRGLHGALQANLANRRKGEYVDYTSVELEHSSDEFEKYLRIVMQNHSLRHIMDHKLDRHVVGLWDSMAHELAGRRHPEPVSAAETKHVGEPALPAPTHHRPPVVEPHVDVHVKPREVPIIYPAPVQQHWSSVQRPVTTFYQQAHAMPPSFMQHGQPVVTAVGPWVPSYGMSLR